MARKIALTTATAQPRLFWLDSSSRIFAECCGCISVVRHVCCEYYAGLAMHIFGGLRCLVHGALQTRMHSLLSGHAKTGLD